MMDYWSKGSAGGLLCVNSFFETFTFYRASPSSLSYTDLACHNSDYKKSKKL